MQKTTYDKISSIFNTKQSELADPGTKTQDTYHIKFIHYIYTAKINHVKLKSLKIK